MHIPMHMVDHLLQISTFVYNSPYCFVPILLLMQALKIFEIFKEKFCNVSARHSLACPCVDRVTNCQGKVMAAIKDLYKHVHQHFLYIQKACRWIFRISEVLYWSIPAMKPHDKTSMGGSKLNRQFLELLKEI